MGSMRRLSPGKAVYHALNTVWSFRQVAARIALPWVPVLLLCGIAEVYVGPPDPMGEQISFAQLALFLVSLIATSSLAVSWHRFVLRDEPAAGLRLDGSVMRYAGYSLLFLFAFSILLLLVLGLAFSAPSAAGFGLPAAVLAGGIVTRLSIKLPAVALSNRAFTFRQAWAASAGNFWPCVGVFLLNAAIVIGAFLALVLLGGGIGQINATLGDFVVALGSLLLQLVYAFLNASILTSLYGYFVEHRDF